MNDESGARSRSKLVRQIVQRLETSYGRPVWRSARDPLEELIQTILSQHTSDINSERAYDELRRRLPTWEAVRDAPVDAVAEAIHSGGLADLKARRIQAVVRQVLEDDADTPLASLATLPLPEAKAALVSLPGVGPKTAACVLLFALGRPALPVDTHVHRVSRRLGMIDSHVNAERAHDELEALLDPADVYSFHLNMITHGRRVCHARKPRCPDCMLRDLCRAFREGDGDLVNGRSR